MARQVFIYQHQQCSQDEVEEGLELWAQKIYNNLDKTYSNPQGNIFNPWIVMKILHYMVGWMVILDPIKCAIIEEMMQPGYDLVVESKKQYTKGMQPFN